MSYGSNGRCAVPVIILRSTATMDPRQEPTQCGSNTHMVLTRTDWLARIPGNTCSGHNAKARSLFIASAEQTDSANLSRPPCLAGLARFQALTGPSALACESDLFPYLMKPRPRVEWRRGRL